MELEQLRCFIAVAEELHFGRAAQRIGLLPASLGRHVRLLEESVGSKLLYRTTRSVSLTEDGVALLEEVRPLLARLNELEQRFRANQRQRSHVLRIGAIDSAAAGLLPTLIQDFRAIAPDVKTQLIEDKSIRLVPKLLAGGLDLAFIRPRSGMSRNLAVEDLFSETPVVAVPAAHALADNMSVSILDLADAPLIVPDRRSRPHSYDLTLNMFAAAGLHPHIAQVADEKQTIVSMVAAGLGLAVVPRWTTSLASAGVRFLPVDNGTGQPAQTLPLAAAWMKAVRDPERDALLDLLRQNLARYSAQA
ncbi:LysR family transcriptional regulator [Rhizobium mongolense]|uniref:HTH-type transcriptional regulator TtuA n=1 Tax=Rhizobium mongolense TaxID=57676 RepID=A0A7W6WES0_9HYPH|nr:LysR family transcriptional regulator [Rhizobium mongolense]MBB4274883.1 DNA-binding transcriptional LysR family regulator [Rhizobium mongolense]